MGGRGGMGEDEGGDISREGGEGGRGGRGRGRWVGWEKGRGLVRGRSGEGVLWGSGRWWGRGRAGGRLSRREGVEREEGLVEDPAANGGAG